jgi:hypothetical protein
MTWLILGIVLLVGVIISIVFILKKRNLSVAKSIVLGFLLFNGLVTGIFLLINFSSWYDSHHTLNYHISGTAYTWADGSTIVSSGVYTDNPDVMKAKTLIPLGGVKISLLSFDKSVSLGFSGMPPIEIIKLESNADGTFDSGKVPVLQKYFPTMISLSKDGYLSQSWVDLPKNNGRIIVIMVKQ